MTDPTASDFTRMAGHIRQARGCLLDLRDLRGAPITDLYAAILELDRSIAEVEERETRAPGDGEGRVK